MNWLLEKAVKEKCALMRMVYISTYAASLQFLTSGRIQKPFNPLLGETFEIVS
jgi:hypothetical protein